MWTANMTTVVTSCLALLLTMFGVNMTAASAPDTNAGDEATIGKQSLLSSNHLSFGVTEILFNISSSTEYLRVQHTQVTVIRQSVLSHLQLLTTLIILENNRLETIGPFAFANFPKLSEIIISGNVALEDIGAFAFSNLPELTDIIITKSRNLRCIHPDAFRNLIKLKYLSISNTGLNSFPDFTKIYSTASGFLFDLHDNSHIMRIPANAFRGLCTQTIREILLTRNGIKEVASDAFNGTKIHRLYLRGNKQLTHIHPKAFVGSSGLTELSRWNSLCSHPKARDDVHFYRDHCSNSTSITCSPLPDEFNPCEDIMSATFLQILIWVISVLTLLGNGVVLLVLLGSRAKLTVPRFLMCHLAFADLCMGVYLVVIATVDVLTRGRYYDYAIDWQRGLGCSAAGFFTVFASELSVFTLTAITLERWHTITYALRLDRKIRLRHACIIMAAGWTFSLITAFLPTVGVSSYSKVSICLPMDVESVESQVYVVSLLLLNILAFFVVCSCYLSIYLTVHNPLSMPAHADTRVAKRMAILIFTDFICMAPISFFAISAALKLPLITVSESKLLLVLFYPINSCSNPFLYAFFTRTFRQDFFILSARFGMFKTRAQIYRTESSSCQQPAWISPKSSHVVLYSLANALSLDAK
ncbi:follicle-stimulating hormone receptor isoform X3 [Cynoglossus semilaevis]|uniref:follicle-stimulating hormone receptor isoform X3 n=1 Tax=Cynoglossus semilaevis TaxID=244447 RepID=UPI000496535A|nr:follicle stimulating hormone receptor isoform X3 [Cynoglossus semilaevis]